MTLGEQMYIRLRTDIVQGVLPPARPLRLEGLKRAYGAGFSPLREALSRLQAERLVEAVPLRGFVVAPLSPEHMWDTIETRILIECQALRKSIARGDDDWEGSVLSALHALTRQMKRMQGGGNPGEEDQHLFETRHRAFHRTLIAACDSEWLLDLSETLYTATERYRYPALRLRGGTRRDRDIRAEHEAIAQAAIDRDPDRATTLLEQHFRLTGDQAMIAMQDDCAIGQDCAPG